MKNDWMDYLMILRNHHYSLFSNKIIPWLYLMKEFIALKDTYKHIFR